MRLSSATIILLTISFAVGCTALPDASPWVDATVQLKIATSAAGQMTVQEIDLTIDAIQGHVTVERIEKLKQERDALANSWKARVEVMKSMVAYAESVQAIVDAGNKGAESAGKVIDSFKGLAAAVGYPIPGSKAEIEIASEAIKLIAKNIQVARAAKKLDKTFLAMQPAVVKLSELMNKDISDLEKTFKAANSARKTAWRTHSDFTDLLPHRTKLFNELRSLDLSHPTNVERGAKLAAISEKADADYARQQNGLEKIYRMRRQGLALIAQMMAGVTAWSAAHGQLASAVKQRKPVSVRSLSETASEIRTLVRRIQEQ